MTTEQDLVRMKQNGLLTSEEFLKAFNQLKTAERRSSQEQNSERMKKRILFSVALLGIFSVLVGLSLIISSNWKIIPSFVKVGGGLICLFASLTATFYFQKRQKSFWMEAFLFVSFLLIGGNLGLIQKTYNLELSWQEGSFAWWALSLPLIFFTKYKLLPLCSVGLLVFALWDIIWNMNYMLVAGLMFMVMLLTHFFSGSLAKFIRDLALIAAIICLYVGDMIASSGAGIIGIITTTLFLLLFAGTPKTEEGTVRYYNYLFLLVAWRIFLLFWNAYYNLTNIGILLVVFGVILLVGVGLYTYYFNKIQNFIRRFIKRSE
ncbi:MAG: DUF2157 domain-containing protein [Alphaproteobacteria bacterium]|nr:DUF2157 domain-containing protein [Alphaproteobacteria bacterium]